MRPQFPSTALLECDIPRPTQETAVAASYNVELPSRWHPMMLSPAQDAYMNSTARFNIVPAGRRGGKSEIAKRRGVKKALVYDRFPDGWFIFGAPTHAQAKRIFWNDLKLLCPEDAVDDISEGALTITLWNGCMLQVMGMDVAERAEGKPLDHIVLDEYGNMKAEVWHEHIRPCLTDRFGTADLTGVPEGRNHYYEMDLVAKADESGEWAHHHWKTADVLGLYLGYRAVLDVCHTDAEVDLMKAAKFLELGKILADRELGSAKREMDLLTYQQEYEADFVAFQGRAYYGFTEANIGTKLPYDPRGRLDFCFDFNVDPGTAVVVQDSKLMTHCIGEVYIQQSSNTPMVCNKLIKDWGTHKGPVRIYADATGGARKTSATEGSDLVLIERIMKSVFGSRVRMCVPRGNPAERDRVNAVNCRCQTMDGQHHLLVDRVKCPKLIRDLEGVQVVEGSAGDIHKPKGSKLSHISDALGYKIVRDHPVGSGRVATSRSMG